MKHSKHCPKCDSLDIVVIEGFRYNQNQVVALNKYGTRTVVLDRYLCANCGYTEEWIQLDERFEKWADKRRASGKWGSDFV